MLRDELLEMIALAERLMAAGETGVVATLFSSRGSTYRGLGSMMVAGPGTTAGGVSGGCLEEYIARHGRVLVREHETAAMMSFDADPDGNAAGKPVLGCGGSIEVIVERLGPGHVAFLGELYAATMSDAVRTAACVIREGPGTSIAVSRCWLAGEGIDPQLARLRAGAMAMETSRYGVLDQSRRALVHYVPPMTRLVILGAGNDTRPLCSLARSLGWHVTVADRRARHATPARFPDADRVIAAEWEMAVGQIDFTPRTAVVLMTHSLADDIEILPLLADKPSAYLGVLGPAHRRRWLLDGVAAAGHALSESFTARVRGPIGLNLGDRSAAGIAVSVVSEILAEINGCDATPRSAASETIVEAWAARG